MSRLTIVALALAACALACSGSAGSRDGGAGSGSAGAGSGSAGFQGGGGAGTGGSSTAGTAGSSSAGSPGTAGTAAGSDAAVSPPDSGDATTGPGGDPVAWGPPFVAVGYKAVRAFSADGKTWTTAPDPAVLPAGWTGPSVYGDNQWLLRGACWGQGKFLAVGGTGGDLGLMLASTDGNAWSLVGGAQANDDCAYGNGLWVTQIRWSQDGTTFTKLTTGTSARRIVYGDGVFVAAGDNSIAYTKDGKSWTSLAITFKGATPADRKGYNHVAFGNHRFLAVNTTIATAPVFEWDGVSDTSFTETPHPADLPGSQTYDLAYGRHAFYVSGFGALYRRADGATTWQKIAGMGGATELYNLAVTDDLFVDERWWSADGALWTKSTNPPEGITKIVATPR